MNIKSELTQRYNELASYVEEKRTRLSPRDESNFLRQLSLMMNAGIDFVEGLSVLEQTMEAQGRKVAKQLGYDLVCGHRLSYAFDRAKDHFSDVTPPLIRAGEKCGALSQTLRMAGDWAEVSSELQAKVKAALIYPVFVLLVNAVLAVCMLTYVLPAFESLFADQDLPLLTTLLVTLSTLFRSKLFWLVVVFLGIEVFLFFTHQDHKERLYRVCLGVPVLRDVLRDSARAKFCAILSITSRTGISVLDCLELASEASGDPEFREQYPVLKHAVVGGEPLASHFLERRDIYGPILAHGMALCEETGNTDGVSTRLAEFFRLETDYRVAQFQALMEPVLISLVSATTAIILLATYLPLVKFLETLV